MQVHVLLAFAIEIDPPESTPLPDSTCNPVYVREIKPHTYLATDDAAGRRDARGRLNSERKRCVGIATTAFTRGAELEWVWAGQTQTWGYRISGSHCYLGLVPYNELRDYLYDSGELAAVSGEIGKLGEFFRSRVELPAGVDARAAYFRTNPFIPVSQAEPGPLRILGVENKPPAGDPPTALTITITATKTITAGQPEVTIDPIALSTGSSYDPARLYESFKLASNFLLDVDIIDLHRDYPGLNKPQYGSGGSYEFFLSTNENYWEQMYGDNLLSVQIQASKYAALGDGETLVDTFVIPGVFPPVAEAVGRFAIAHPWIYADPALAGVTGTYAAWPEAIPDLSAPVPAGTDLTIPGDIPEGYDPYLGRVPGSVEARQEHDNATGLKLMLVEVLGYEGDAANLTPIPCCDG